MRERTTLEIEHSRLGLQEREVIGDKDTRNPVKDSFLIPFRFICHLEMAYKKTAQKAGGTGILIGRKFILTCAHNLLTVEKREARRIVVSPARNGDANSIGGIDAANWIVHTTWRGINWPFDYALIKLEKDVGGDNFIETDWKTFGCWGDPKNGGGTSLTPLDAADLDGRRVFVAGYPGGADHQNFKMSGDVGVITGIAANRPVHKDDLFLHHTVDTSKGESGSPLWVRDDKTNVRTLVGIHSRAGRQENGKFVTNVAVRITPKVIAQLNTWMKTL